MLISSDYRSGVSADFSLNSIGKGQFTLSGRVSRVFANANYNYVVGTVAQLTILDGFFSIEVVGVMDKARALFCWSLVTRQTNQLACYLYEDGSIHAVIKTTRH